MYPFVSPTQVHVLDTPSSLKRLQYLDTYPLIRPTYLPMAHSVPYPSTDPLLGKTSKPINETHSPPLSSTTRTIIKVLSVVRIATGTACLIAPRFTCALFMYPIAAEYGFLVRMVGARDIVFGELLMTAEDKGREDGGRQ